MTDREMLEMAAKAAGIGALVWGEKYKLGDDEIDCSDIPYIRSGQPDEGDVYWNPLTDDGDALRLLAVRKLAVSWEYMPSHVLVEDTESDHHAVEQIIDGDRASALRRAATACMAEIGMAMP